MGKLKKSVSTLATRKDGWENVLTGLGVDGKDKRKGTRFSSYALNLHAAEALWREDDLAARIVETLPNEMTREGFEFIAPEDKAASEAVEEAARELDLLGNLYLALCTARALGGAGILLGVDDGLDPKDWNKPLRLESVRELRFLSVFSPLELQASKWYNDPLQPFFGEVAEYTLTPYSAPTGSTRVGQRVHASRIVRLDGIKTSRIFRFSGQAPGWDDSVLVRCAQVISDYQAAWAGASILTQDFSVATLKLKGLAELLASAEGGADGVRTRAAAIEQSRGIANVALIDSEEEFKRETTNVTGLSELLQQFAQRLAAAAQMPVTLLMGQSPAGLNATGDSDVRWFYDQISAHQESKLRAPVRRIFEVLLASKQGPTGGRFPANWDFRFNPLWQLSDKEQAELREIQARADVAYINAQVLLPEEVANSRFGGDEYSTQTQLDTEAREAMADALERAEDAEEPEEDEKEEG